MMQADIKVLYNDEGLIIAEKPYNVPSQPDKTGDADMLSLLSNKYGTIYPVHRLDRPVAGIMVFAKSSVAASKLCNNNINKQYIAVVCGMAAEEASLKHFLIKNQRLNTSKAVHQNTPNAKEALLNYTRLNTIDNEYHGILSKVLVNLITGRHHQIRVQFAATGLPIWGDTKYNHEFSKARGFFKIGLAACKIEFIHPFNGTEMKFCYEPLEEPFSYFPNDLS